MLRVLGRVTSINVRKVLWALDELGLAYNREDWGLPIRDPKVPEFLALNPNGQVPVLVDGDFSMWESNAILVYLAERYGMGVLLSDDIRTRAPVIRVSEPMVRASSPSRARTLFMFWTKLVAPRVDCWSKIS